MQYRVTLDARVTQDFPVENVFADGFHWDREFVRFFEHDESENERVVKTFNKTHVVAIESVRS